MKNTLIVTLLLCTAGWVSAQETAADLGQEIKLTKVNDVSATSNAIKTAETHRNENMTSVTVVNHNDIGIQVFMRGRSVGFVPGNRTRTFIYQPTVIDFKVGREPSISIRWNLKTGNGRILWERRNIGSGRWVLNIPATQENAADLGQEIKLTKVNYISAASIPFKKELGVAFPGLLTLGVRIELAARDNDSVGLIAAGLELKAAETAAGKTAANYKADDVIKRGTELALERNDIDELKGVKSLLPENEIIAKALKVAEASKDESARATPLTLKKHAEREQQRRLTVNNYRDVYADVHINGRYYGRVDHRQSQVFYPHGDRGHIHLHYGDDIHYEAPHSHLHGYVEIR